MDTVTVRTATADDLDAIAALTRAKRHRLAEWSPTWWRVADGADELHPLWLGHLVATDGPVARVAVDDTGVVGCAISVPQGDDWFVDDVAGTTPSVVTALLEATTERPARTCVPTLDADGTAAAVAAGLVLASSYWIGPPGRAAAPSDVPAAQCPVPPHTFGAAADGLVVDLPGVGPVRGSDPLPPPPVYGAGGTVTVLTSVEGPDRAAALTEATRVVAERGDVLVCLVVATDDADLTALAESADLVRTVDVWAWV